MIIAIGDVYVQVPQRKAAEQAMAQAQAHAHEEPGCVSYKAHFVDGEPATVVIYEQFADQAALDYHRNAAHFHQYAIGGLYQKMLERQVENLTAVC